MKKYLSLLFAIFAVCFSTTLISCGDDDDDTTTTPKDDTTKVTSRQVAFTFTPTADFFKVADVYMEYTDTAGKTQTEAITSAFNKTFTVTKFPANGEFRLKYTLKDNIDLTQEYELGYSYNLNLGTFNEDKGSNTITTDPCTEEEFKQTMDDMFKGLKFVWKFNESGTATDYKHTYDM